MRVTSKGQVTIPKHIREKLGIAPGDDIAFREEGQAVIVEVKDKHEGGQRSGAKLAQALVELGKRGRAQGWLDPITIDEVMMTRGCFDDVNPR